MRRQHSFVRHSLTGCDRNPGVILAVGLAPLQRRLPTHWLRAALFMPSIWTPELWSICQTTMMESKFVRRLGREGPSLRLPPVDGILMANTLHFIQEQQKLLRGFCL